MALRRNMSYEQAAAADLLRRGKRFGSGNGIRSKAESYLSGLGQERDGGSTGPYPWDVMPPGASEFNFNNTASVILPATGSEVAVVTFTVPPGRHGVIRAIANQFVGGGWVEGSGDIVWRLERDGIPIFGYDSILSSLGSTASPGRRQIRIYENEQIRLICNNVLVAPAGQVLLGLLYGYFYPVNQEGVPAWL